MSLYCAEVLPAAPDRTARDESAGAPDTAAARRRAHVKVLLISERPDGFCLERLGDAGPSEGATLHETLDEAMRRAYCDYEPISAWRLCPEGVDPMQYLGARSDS